MYKRQLKRFDIKVKGAGSDRVEKFFWSTESAVLFPEFVSRVVRQGMEEESILPDITATVTNFDGMDYRSIASTPTEEEKKLKRVEEGAQIPQTTIHTQENLVRLHKRGRMLVAPYEAIRFQRLDLFAVTLRQIGAYMGRLHLEDAVKVLKDGDGNNNACLLYTSTEPSAATIAFLTDKVREEGISTVWYIEFSNHLVADAIAEAAGAGTAMFHTCHNVSPNELAGGETYVTLMRGNLERLRAHLSER